MKSCDEFRIICRPIAFTVTPKQQLSSILDVNKLMSHPCFAPLKEAIEIKEMPCAIRE